MDMAPPGLRIVVVDDDPAFSEFLQCALEDLDGETVVLPDPEEALAYIQCAQPDLVILDIRICPTCTGWEILEQLRKDARTAPIPVVVCSAATDELQANEALLSRHGVISLPKPFNLEELYAVVELALAQRRSDPLQRAGA